MGLFISQMEDWKMVEYLGLMEKLRALNSIQKFAWVLYLYGNPVYSIIYRIIRPYKN